jgi:hypothetical protein
MPSNLPDNVSYNDASAPWNQTREPVQDAHLIEIAIAELDELVSSLKYLDRHYSVRPRFAADMVHLKELRERLQEDMED